jgi:hypothetical protein
MLAEGCIDARDLDLLTLTDSPDQAIGVIADAAERQFGFKWTKQRMKRKWFLGE